MSRPAGEPASLVAGSGTMGGAAAALREVRGRLGRATSFEVVAGAWRGPASEAFQVDGAALQVGLGRAADTLERAAATLSELAARLDHAQAAWDRAQRLAATVGVDLGSHADASPATVRSAWNPDGGVRSPADAVDPAAMLVGGQALSMAAAADKEAAAARRAAAARLDQAADAVAASPSRGRGGAMAPTGQHGGAGHAGGEPGDAGDRHGGRARRMVGGVLEVGAEMAAATHHLLVAAETRAEAAGRLAVAADDPAVRAAAGRVAQAAGRPMVDGRILGALPLFAPILDFAASVSHGEPLPRALAGAVGTAVGADLGSRAGLAICGGEAAATQGVGLIVCPTLTAVGGAVGAEVGKAAALHVYDELTEPDPAPPHPDPAPSQPDPAPPHPDPGPSRPERPDREQPPHAGERAEARSSAGAEARSGGGSGAVRPGSGPGGGPGPGPGSGG